jgi:hypothetical protein
MVPFFSVSHRRDQLAFLMRLLLRHCVQTRIRLGDPSTSTRTVCRLGYHRRLVLLLAWLTLLPVTGPLAHTAQTRAISSTPNLDDRNEPTNVMGTMPLTQPAGAAVDA